MNKRVFIIVFTYWITLFVGCKIIESLTGASTVAVIDSMDEEAADKIKAEAEAIRKEVDSQIAVLSTLASEKGIGNSDILARIEELKEVVPQYEAVKSNWDLVIQVLLTGGLSTALGFLGLSRRKNNKITAVAEVLSKSIDAYKAFNPTSEEHVNTNIEEVVKKHDAFSEGDSVRTLLRNLGGNV